MTDERQAFAELLRKGRYKIGKTQKEVAGQIGVKQATINKWENDEGWFPEKWRLPWLATVYGLSTKNVKLTFKLSQKAWERQKVVKRTIRKRRMSGKLFAGEVGCGIIRKNNDPDSPRFHQR